MLNTVNVTFSSTYRGGEEFIEKLQEHFGIKDKPLPQVVCFGGDDHEKKFIMEGTLTQSNIEKFV